MKAQGQIAHLDHDSSNNSLENLAYLCVTHHAMYDTVARQAKGLTIAEMRYFQSELYRHLGTTNKALALPSLSLDQIEFTSQAREDCSRFRINTADVSEYLCGETRSHPILLTREFGSSLFSMYFSTILLISWDFKVLRVERLLTREVAYPANDAWSNCLALYRRATRLPYRQPGPNKLLSAAHTKYSVNVMAMLARSAQRFLSKLGRRELEFESKQINSLLSSAERAFELQDNALGAAKLEMLLSTVHKLVLRHAPDHVTREGRSRPESILGVMKKWLRRGKVRPVAPSEPTETIFDVSASGIRRSALIVDDEIMYAATLIQLLQEAGFDVSTVTTASDARRMLVDTEFDLLIVDVLFADASGRYATDGLEIVRAARIANPKTKTVILTAYTGMTREADLSEWGIDDVIPKAAGAASEVVQRIEALFLGVHDAIL